MEYKLISGLKNNLHKENINWRRDIMRGVFASRRSIFDIHNQVEDQSNVLESEK
jgi:hypothetical protein